MAEASKPLRGFPCSLGRNGKIEQIQAIQTEIGRSHVTKFQSRGRDLWEGLGRA